MPITERDIINKVLKQLADLIFMIEEDLSRYSGSKGYTIIVRDSDGKDILSKSI